MNSIVAENEIVLDASYQVSEKDKKDYATNGFARINNICSKEELEPFREALNEIVDEFKSTKAPLSERDLYGRAFIQVPNIWERSNLIRKLGKLDYFFGLESSYINELLTPEGALQPSLAGQFIFLKNPYLNSEYLGIRMDSAINGLQQKKVRQALNYGIDRKQMLRLLRNGVGRPATSGFTPFGLPSFDDQKVPGYGYDPARAGRLLAEAGFPQGRGLPPITLLRNADYLDLCTFLARQWDDLGIKVNIESTETALLRERMRNGKAPFFRASWIADYPDGESFLTCFYSKNAAPPNYTHFSNAAYDRLYEQSLLATDANERYTLYHEMEKILIEEAPVVFLFYDETAQFASSHVQGLSRNAINLLSLKRVRKN